MGHPPRLPGTVLACLFLLFAGAASAGKCSIACHGMPTKNAYQEGHTYTYNLEGASVTNVTDAQGTASLKVSATVELSAKSDCLYQLRLKNVQLNGAPPSTPDVEQYAIQFGYHNGLVDPYVCAESGDSQASLNLKRAVISLFQSSALTKSGTTTRDEIDVMGSCPTEFSVRKAGEVQTVHKSRNLADCSFRENINQGLVSATTDTEAGLKSAPLLASQQEVEQRFERGVLKEAVSNEYYKLNPFSNGNAGAHTFVETKLTFKLEKPENSPAVTGTQTKSLVFDAPHPVIKSSPAAIANALNAAKAEVTDGVRPEAAGKFEDLVKVVRLSNKDDILSVYQKVKGASKEERKLLLDAICRAGSGEAAEVAVELIKNKEVTGVQAFFFYTSLALVRHVNLPSVAAVTSLLDQPNLPRIGYLGVGQVVGKYCQHHTCENVNEVKEAIRKIREKVGNGKAKTREQENLVVSALKALGNTQFLDDATLQKLANIGADKNVRNRVRVAAIEALPTRCSMKWKNIMFKVLADLEEDSEIRIKSYLSLVACPCPHVAGNLKEVLNKETVNQVGSFIQSHLRNLRASTDPNKQNAKNQLGLIKPRTRFPEDFRKFSFNNELSYTAGSLGLGSTLESNVIYSQNSFVPRSANLNLTAEIFGRNFNFLDLNTRVENLDRVLEHYFGPKGKLWEKDMQGMTNAGTNAANNVRDYAKERYEKLLRGKREVKQGELDRFAKNVHLRNNEVDENLNLDLSVKLFGVELAYLSYQGDSNKLKPEAIVDSVFDNLDKVFDKVKNLNYDLENYLQFLEAELVYPTNMGSSLTLGLTGTSAVRVKTNGKVDVPAILKDPSNAALRIAVEPSVSVRIVGNMVVQGLGAESGIKVVNTLHTTTSTDVSVTMLDGKGMDVNVGVPKKKQELISVSSEVLFSDKEKGNKYVAPKFGKGKEYADCFDQLSPLIGLTVCGKISYPYEDASILQQKPLFPLSGPAKLSITVENNDVNNYHFKVYLDTESPNKRSFEIMLDTPNSKANRLVSLAAEVGVEPNKYVRVSLNTPIKKASLEAVLKNNAQERTLTVTILHDQMEYYGQIGVLASGGKYKPVLEYRVPEHIEKLASAKTGVKTGQNYNVQGTVDVSDHEGGQKFVLDKVALVVSGKKLVTVDGSVMWTPNAVNLDMDLVYADKDLALKVDGKKVAKGNYMLTMSAMSSKDPNIGMKLKWDFNADPNGVENQIVLTHGPNLNSKVNRLSLEQKFKYNLDPKNRLLDMSNELKYPLTNLELKLDGKATSKSLSGDVEVKYEKFKMGAEVSAARDMKKPGDYEVEAEAELMENSIKVKSKRTVLDGTKNKYSNSLVLTPGGRYDADATVTYDVSKNSAKVQMDGDLNLNGKKVKVDTSLEANQMVFNSEVFVKVDGVKYVEFLLQTRRPPNPSGNLNLNLKNYLTATGQYAYQNGKGHANLNIDVPKINRKIKANGELAVSGTEHLGNFEILYDAEKDPKKRIKLFTISDITKTSIDTKNVLEVHAYKLELNGKGNMKGTLNDGQLQMDGDLTLPNGRFLAVKLKRSATKKDNKYDVQVDSQVTDSVKKGGESRKLVYNADFKDVDPQLMTYQGNAQLEFVDFDGKNLQVALDGKRQVQSKDEMDNTVLKVSGAKMPRKFQLHVGTSRGDGRGVYTVMSSLGDDLSLAVMGFFELGNNFDKPHKMESTLELKLPSEKLSNLKLEVTRSMLGDSEEKNIMEILQGVTLTYNNDKKIKMEYDLKLKGLKVLEESSEGTGLLKINILQHPQLKVESMYKNSFDNDKNTFSGDMVATYGDKKLALRLDTEDLPDLLVVNLNAKCTLIFAKLKNVELQLVQKVHKKENKRETDAVAMVDNDKYTLKSEIQQQDMNSLFHVEMSCPTGKTELLSKVEKLGAKEYKAEWKVITPKEFIVADIHVDLNSVDEFVINGNLDTNKMARRKLHFEMVNKPTAKTGKKIIVITVTSDGQNIVTGRLHCLSSINYKKRDEDGKVVVEGNGSLKVGDDTTPSSFKYTRQQLTHENDGEVGVAIVLNANFGPSAIVGELKLSNKELHVFESYCEQTKSCAHFKLQSTLNTQEKNMLKHQVTVEVDLKKFNVPAEFGLKTNTEVKAPLFSHTTNLYLHSTKDKSEYTYQVYLQPKEAATVLSLPSREIALVATYDLPKTGHTKAFKLDTSLYLDRKNKPSDKTSLMATGNVDIKDKSISLNGETKFVYPTQHKDLSVKGSLRYGGENLLDANMEFDVFAKTVQKITVTAKVQRQQVEDGNNVTCHVNVNSNGQNLKLNLDSHLMVSSKKLGLGSFLTYNDVHQKPKSLGGLFSANPNQVNLLVTLPDQEIIRDEWKMKFTKNLQKIDREVSVLGDQPVVTNIEANNLNRFSYLRYPKDNPNEKFTVNGQVVLGQLAEIHATYNKDGAKKKLFHGMVHLDEKQFLKPDFGYNKENVAEVLDKIKNVHVNRLKKLKDVQEYVMKEVNTEVGDLVNHLKKAQPNLKPLVDYYQRELNKLEEEVKADETVKEIHATLNKYFGGIVTAVAQTMKGVAEDLQKLMQHLNEILSNLKDSAKPIYMQLKESYDKVFHELMNVLDAAGKLANTYLNALLNLINEHQKELKDLFSVVSDVAQDFSKVLSKTLERIRLGLEEFCTLLINQLKALPIYEKAQEKLEELKNFQVPEMVLKSMEEVFNVIKSVMPTQELSQLVDTVSQHIMKHAKREKVDELVECKKIYTQAVAAVQSVLALTQNLVTTDNLLALVKMPLQLDLSYLAKLPGIYAVKVSVLNLLRNGELPTPSELYFTYRPTLYPSDLVPPFSKSAVVADGGHFFTFDGRHLTMSGTCTYILAQDMQDGNFSVVGNFNDGNLISVTVTEPKETITLKSNGNILVNNKPADYPASTKNLHAYLVLPFANVKSNYGVRVTCTNKAPMVCAVHVSGFYLDKMRGLLGNGNNEPYDDYTLPSGKITDSSSDFGNAYKLKGDCPNAAAAPHADHAPVCTEYFVSQTSPLQSCYAYVSPAHYREACDHAVAAKTTEGPCLIAMAYHYACYAAGIKSTHVPSSCSTTSCKVGANTVAAGDTFSVKVPKKEADVIFVVEQETPNENVFKEMVTPLISELRDELKHQGMTDVHIALIGYSEKMKWPQHYTLNGDTNINGEVKTMKFHEKKPVVTLEATKQGDAEKKLEYLHQRLDIELGTFNLNDAYEEAVRYPFRPGAARAVVGVLANPCEKSPLPVSLQQLRLLMGQKIYQDLGLTYYHVSFPKELLVSGKPQKNIVGYDQDSVFTFADSKKKPLSGNSDMKNNLVASTTDVCADFAVTSGGAAFSVNNFMDAKPNQKKQFIQVAARRIADGLASVEIQRDCLCDYQFGVSGRSKCKIVGRKEKESPARHTKGGVKE
ncbi:retinoid- and fatty-acid binding glycoprotein apolipophorin isoform X1 [Colletes latitarsis]|uniref:retinoid- and fatty-acid binding glycoprotein apolipophorin isoform X1 n=1 Tax=Colletes latitarsis TaxID=2605962 RepID=UPI00403728F1